MDERANPAPRLERRPDGELVIVTGASGSGKTVYTMRAAARAARLLVWDSHLQWWGAGCEPVRTIPELARACRTRESRQLAYIGPVNRDTFEKFCIVARCWLMLARATVVIEELADVVPPGKAPPAWGELVRWNRKLGGTIYALTQRPQESDKTSLANAARIVCHAVNGRPDAVYMAPWLGVEPADILALRVDRLEHIERRRGEAPRKGATPRPSRRASAEHS